MSDPDWSPDTHRQLARAARIAANSVAAEHNGYVDRDDLASEAMAWFLEHPDRVHRATDEDGNVYTRRLVVEARRKLVPYARWERTVRSGGDPADDVKYTPQSVRLLLPAVWTGEGPEKGDDLGGRGGGTDPAFAGVWAVMVAEVRAAMRTCVGLKDQGLLFRHYVTGDDWSTVAHHAGVSPQLARVRASRAVGEICDELNGLHKPPPGLGDGLGSRRVVSNATARALSDGVYQGGVA